MNKVLIVGSVALDTVKTPAGIVNDALGGSAVYSSLSCSYFAPVDLVAVAGSDFQRKNISIMTKHGIDLTGLEIVDGRTFRWSGQYGENYGDAETLETHLNVFEFFDPKVPSVYARDKFVFLANIHPLLQHKVLKSVKKPRLTVCDTMNLWIDTAGPELLSLIKDVDIFVLNETEARMLSGQDNLIKAAKTLLKFGPDAVIIKKGANGSMFYSGQLVFSTPAYMLETLKDPTGAGDTFAGAFTGYLASQKKTGKSEIKKAVIYGTIMSSFTVEQFSVRSLGNLNKRDINKRYKDFLQLTQLS